MPIRTATRNEFTMPLQEIRAILIEILGVDVSRVEMDEATRLLGHLPEFDSMAVVSVLTAIEDRFGIVIDDDDIDASVFETVGTLTAFVRAKCAA